MRTMIPVLLTAALAVNGHGMACDAPTLDPDIPNGRSATREDMVAAQKAVLALDGAVRAYTACLQAEQKREISQGISRPQAEGKYTRLQNEEVTRLQKIAERFNTELRAFKSQNAG